MYNFTRSNKINEIKAKHNNITNSTKLIESVLDRQSGRASRATSDEGRPTRGAPSTRDSNGHGHPHGQHEEGSEHERRTNFAASPSNIVLLKHVF